MVTSDPYKANYGTWKLVVTVVQRHFASDLSQKILNIFLVCIWDRRHHDLSVSLTCFSVNRDSSAYLVLYLLVALQDSAITPQYIVRPLLFEIEILLPGRTSTSHNSCCRRPVQYWNWNWRVLYGRVIARCSWHDCTSNKFVVAVYIL